MDELPLPLVRYMIVCDEILRDQQRPGKPVIVGLICLITPESDPPYPFWLDRMCVFLILTEGRGTGSCQLRLVFEEPNEVIWETNSQPISFGDDPLALRGIIFRDRQVPFPSPGIYTVQFWYNNHQIAHQTIRAR